MAAAEEKAKVASAPGGGAVMVAGDAAPPNAAKGSTKGTRVIGSLAFSPALCFFSGGCTRHHLGAPVACVVDQVSRCSRACCRIRDTRIHGSA
jgi:hypothetical protein